MTTEELKIVISVEAQEAINKVKAVKQQVSDLGNTSGTAKVKTAMADSTKEIQKMKDALSKIPGVGGKIAGAFGTIATAIVATKAVLNTTLGWMKNAVGEFLGAFDFKNFDLGDDGLKGLIDTMKISFQEAGISMGQAFGKGKAAASGAANAAGEAGAAASGAGAAAGSAAAGFAALAAAVAVVAGMVLALVAAVRTAIKVSEQLNATFFEARKVGLTTAAYQELSYVLGQVGVGADKLSDFIKSLSAAQNDLRDGSEGMVEAFETLGMSVEEATRMTQEELFIETIKRLQQMEDGIERTGIAYRIFGEDDAAEVANLLALNNAEMERMINNFYLLGGSASDSAVQKSLELQSALSNMRLAWQGISNTIGEAVMPALTAVVNAIAKAIAAVNMFLRALFGMDIVSKGSKSVNKASASVGGYGASLKKAAGAAEQLKRSTMGFDELNIVPSGKSPAGGSDDSSGGGGGGGSFEMPEISGMTEDLGLDKIAAFIEKWKGVIQTAVPIAMVVGGLIGGIACLFSGNFVAAIPLLAMAGLGIAIGSGNGLWSKLGKGIVKVWEDIKTKTKKIWNDVKKFLSDTWNKIKTTCSKVWDSIKKFISNTWNSIKTTATNVWNAIKTFLTNIWNGIKSVATTIWNAIVKFFSDTWNSIKSTATTAWNAIKKFFTDSWNAIKSTATTIWNAVKKFFSDTWESIKTTATNVWNSISQFFTNLWNGIKNTATNIWNAITQFFSDTWNSIKTTATNAWNGIKSMLETAWNAVKTAATTLCDNLKKFFSDAWEAIKGVWSVVAQFFQDIWDDIKEGASDLVDKVKNFFSNAWTTIKGVWDVVKKYFQDIWDNIKKGASDLWEKVKGFFSSAWTAIKGVWDVVKGYFQDIWTAIKNAASSMWDSVKGFFSGAWTAIKNVWNGAGTWFGGIWTGIKNAFSNVGTWFGNIFGGAWTAVKNAWSNVKEWFAEKWEGIKSVFTGAGSAISDGITGALKSTFNSFMSGAVGLINKFIRAINSAIDLINKIPGVSIGKLSTLSVPQLAKGGIVTDSILANIGERGREAVLPLENNTGWMNVLADKIAARNGSTRVILQVDGRELGWATIENINAITKQTGGLQLVL